ncbi:hypothetical protein LCGC14_3003690, partial [marine sediment metagenome]
DVYSSDDVEEYLRKFDEKDKPNNKKRGSFTFNDFLDKEGAPKTKTKIMAVSKKPIIKKNHKVFPSHIKRCTLNNERIRDSFIELKSLNTEKHPNAISVLLRTFIEMSLFHYLNKLGHIKIIKEIEQKKKDIKADKKGKPKQNLQSDWTPSLREMLHYITHNSECQVITDGHHRRMLKTFLSDRYRWISLDTLHQLVHNKYFKPDEASIKEFVNQLTGLFEVILIEPED